MTAIETVEAFLDAYFAQDVARALSLVTDGFGWLNMALPKARIEGREMFGLVMSRPNLGMHLPLKRAHHDTRNWLEGDGLLMHERIDYLEFEPGALAIPCAAVFRVAAGRVAEWRDYYDIGGYLRFMAAHGIAIDTSAWF